MPAPYYRLRLKSLTFISAVDAGAQGSVSNVALIKRAPSGDDVTATFKVVKTDDKLGLVFGWALASTIDGGATPHVDLQRDAIIGDDELIKVAADFMERSAVSDVMHDDKADGKIVFAMPLTKDVANALGVTTKVHGLAIAMRPSPETFKRFVKGELKAFSIAGHGVRELVKGDKPQCAGCGKYGAAGDAKCADCGDTMKRAARPPRVPRQSRKRVGKADAPTSAVLTTTTDGHQHSLDLDAPANGWSDQLSTSYQTADGATQGHSHAWTFDADGKITIAEDSGHTHSTDAVVPDDVLRQAMLNQTGERCCGCSEMVEDGCRFCPRCGAAMDRRDAVPAATTDEPSGPSTAVVVVAARAPDSNSPPGESTPTVKSNSEEPTMPPDANDRIRQLETENARLEKMATLTDGQRAHFAKLSGSDAAQFLAMSPPARDAALSEIAKSDSIVYTSPVSGKEYRKSVQLEIIELVQQADAATIEMRKQAARTQVLEFEKRAAVAIPNFAKGAKGDIPFRLMRAVDGEFKEAAEHDEVVRALKGANHALEMLTKANGVNPHADPAAGAATPVAELAQLAQAYATKHNVPLHKAHSAVLDTPEGAAIYKRMPVGNA
jgi:hypothetical protein